MGTFKKLFASIAAVMIVVSTAPVAVFGQTSWSQEYQDAYAYAYANGITTMSSIDAANLAGTTTRAQAAKMFVEFAKSLGQTADTSASCSFSDLAPIAGTDLAGFAVEACQMGLMGINTNGIFNPNGVLSRAEYGTILSRVLFGDVYNGGNPFYAAHLNALNQAGLMNDLSNPERSIMRGDAFLLLFRASTADLEGVTPGFCADIETVFACTIDPDGSMGLCPAACIGGTTPTEPGEENEVKAGGLQLSLGANTPANGASIPNNGIVSFGEIKFTAASSDVRVNSVTLTRQGLGDRSDISRVYFERNGVRVSSRGSLASDGVVTVSFSPALVVKAGSSESLDLVASLVATQAGSEHRFAFTDVNSSAQTASFDISTPTLRTTTYPVGSVAFTRQGTTGSIQGSEVDFEIGRFKLDNTSSNDKEVKVKALTFRNAGNGSLSNGLANLALYKNSEKVSTDVVINGRDVTFVVNTTLTSSENGLFYIRANAAAVENEAGDTYRFELRNAEDVNATELTTNFRVSLTGFTTTVSSPTYTVNGGDVQISRDTSVSLSSTVSSSDSNVVLAKGTITAKKAITLEDLKFALTVNGGALTGVVQKLTLKVGNQTSSYTPASSAVSVLSDKFDGTFNVNGSVSFQITADLRSSFTGTATVQVASIELTDFDSAEYVANGNAVDGDQLIGSLSTVNVNVQ